MYTIKQHKNGFYFLVNTVDSLDIQVANLTLEEANAILFFFNNTIRN
jgi:hypothetical protein